MRKLLKINNTKCGLLKTTLLALAGLFFILTVNAQSEIDRLHLPAEYAEVGQKVYEGYKLMFAKISDYVHKNEHITKAGIDSVRQAALAEYAEVNPQTKDALLGKNPDNAVNPKVQKLLEEVFSAIKAKSLTDIANKLGKINQKAAKTLPETEAVIVYAVTCTSYYSAKYWQTSFSEWQELGEYIKLKALKAKNQ
ncbi:MAG: hypothetical protein LBD59_12490 [Prevotellaceae bacterium]|jgi:hypothetical protein|nr:hypothetical protein [Prevotellaceae bacterium]